VQDPAHKDAAEGGSGEAAGPAALRRARRPGELDHDEEAYFAEGAPLAFHLVVTVDATV
jgi:hypothetical protein